MYADSFLKGAAAFFPVVVSGGMCITAFSAYLAKSSITNMNVFLLTCGYLGYNLDDFLKQYRAYEMNDNLLAMLNEKKDDSEDEKWAQAFNIIKTKKAAEEEKVKKDPKAESESD